MAKSVKALYAETWRCPGPNRRTNLVDGEFAGVGTEVNYDKCMEYPDCGCRRFDEQVQKIEDAVQNCEADSGD